MLVASTSLALAAMIATSGTATAAVVLPYTDANATSGITLCDAQGRAITGGRNDAPLAASVVGGTAAEPMYAGSGRSASLAAYQPRQGVDPGQWSGMGMTGLSRYTNIQHPMAEILPRDYRLKDFVEAYTPKWDGLVQLRIYLRAANRPTKNDSYAATTLKVSGSSWQQVGASAGAVCTAGTAESVLRILGLPTAAPTARPAGSGSTAPPGASSSSRPGSGASKSTPSGVPNTSDPSAAQASSALAVNPAGASTTNGDGFIWVLSVALLAAAGMLWWFWNRRRQARLNGS
jgi:hypothetical protein